MTCEVGTADGRGRIDLLLESRDRRRCVVIENKPWAGWQENQLARYRADQHARRDDVRLHALIGGQDAFGALERHWAQSTADALPSAVTASGFDAVAVWLEDCAAGTRADKVRHFLYDLAEYCRRYILNEPSMTEIDNTADLILAGGPESLRAAGAIAAALPLAMTRDVARRLSRSVVMVGGHASVQVTVDGVPLNFVLFTKLSPWAGVTDIALAPRLRGNEGIQWGAPERLWPRWTYLNKVGEQGRALVRAIASDDLESVALLVPAVARILVGCDPT